MRGGGRISLRRWVAVTVAALVLVLPATAARAVLASGIQCVGATLPVTATATDPTVYHLVGTLCGLGTWQGKTVQVLTPGGSYDHDYWSFPYEPDTYSYVEWATNQGLATFDIDRLGTGASDYPPSSEVTGLTSAYVEHQIVSALRAGAVGGYAFGTVVLVGHSFGSMVSLIEASRYQDVDGVIATGFLHTLNSTGFSQVGVTFVPASSAPLGYITTEPGARGPDFYDEFAADPLAIAADEALKSVDSGATLSDMEVPLDPAVSQAITAPVLLVVGTQDKLFCDPSAAGLSCASSADIMAREAGDYGAAACLEAVVQTASGHSIALHPNAHDGFAAMTDWTARRVGTGPGSPPSQPCLLA